MDISIASYVRKSFGVDAIQVTSENMNAVAEWCGGEVRDQVEIKGGVRNKNQAHIYLTAVGYRRQTMAFPGDWILCSGESFRVYTDKAFKHSFEPVGTNDKHAEVLRLVLSAMSKQDVATHFGESSKGMDLVAENVTKQIVKLFG